VGLVGGNLRSDFLLPIGLLEALLGVLYLMAFIGSRGVSDNLAFWVARGVGVVGLLVFLIALVRSTVPAIQEYFRASSTWPKYLIPNGALLMALGAVYGVASVLTSSDRKLAVLTRRELGAFVYSPIVYIVLFGSILVDAINFLAFTWRLSQGPVPEPAVAGYVIAWIPVFCIVVFVPALTMRLMSEEKRSGTLEVLLTTPVDEPTVVLSKFLAALLMFWVVWVPFFLFLLALYVLGGSPFDYQPLLCFFVVLTLTGGMFVSMGLFFSSLTRNQIVGGVLTFAFTLILTFVFFIKMFVGRTPDDPSAWATVLNHISYIDVWESALRGVLVPKYLVFYVTMTVLWLFLSIKVLEARKWT
jgi:ABC-2 type transport system permease protein